MSTFNCAGLCKVMSSIFKHPTPNGDDIKILYRNGFLFGNYNLFSFYYLSCTHMDVLMHLKVSYIRYSNSWSLSFIVIPAHMYVLVSSQDPLFCGCHLLLFIIFFVYCLISHIKHSLFFVLVALNMLFGPLKAWWAV